MEKMAINGATPFLPQEILSNILKRLPVKYLLRFRCVCKHWENLLKTSSFIQDHLCHSTHHNSPLLIGPNNRDDEFYLLSLNRELRFREIEVAPLIDSLIGLCLMGSSNGLLFFAHWSRYPPNIHCPSPLLWNPATREVRQVPIISDDFSDLGWGFGFGFNPIINDYRIVKLSFSPRVSKVEVYSLSTGCWRKIEFDKVKDVSAVGHGVTANGVMFWHGYKDIMDTQYTDVMISFDLATEVFTVISWPAFAIFGKLAVYDDKLAIISCRKTKKDKDDWSSLYFEVMKEGDIHIDSSKERWSSSEKYIGNSNLPFYAGTIWRNQIVTIDAGVYTSTEHGDEIIMNHLYLIDVNANECKQFDIPRPKAGRGVCVFNYVESLVPVSGNIQIEEP